MDITPYVESLRRDLLAAAESGTDDVRAAAERLTLALDPAARLALMEALSHAAAEITSGLPAGSVDVRLNGRELDFVVEQELPAVPAPPAPPAPPTPPRADDAADDDTLARVTLRLPESIKTRAEELAQEAGQSLNTWLVATLRRATTDDAARVDVDLSSIGIPGPGFPFSTSRRNRLTGWL